MLGADRGADLGLVAVAPPHGTIVHSLPYRPKGAEGRPRGQSHVARMDRRSTLPPAQGRDQQEHTDERAGCTGPPPPAGPGLAQQGRQAVEQAVDVGGV
jgi:hypothetical protein